MLKVCKNFAEAAYHTTTMEQAQRHHTNHLEHRVPTRREAAWFWFRAMCFRVRHTLRSLVQPSLRRHPRERSAPQAVLLATSRSELWTHGASASERRLQLGKVQNLRTAGALLDGVTVPAGETFSFWKQIGRATLRRGFAKGRELREGCLIPTLGGGLCQLSGALYSAALDAGLEIVERHAHTERGVSKMAQLGRDATIFWNYVDLRLRAPFPWRVEVRLSAEQLIVRIAGFSDALVASGGQDGPALVEEAAPGACDTCGITECFRHLERNGATDGDRTAVLVDEFWPEYDAYLQGQSRGGALLCRPLNGRPWRKANYAWSSAGFAECASATWTALRRAWASRRLAEQGAARQQALLSWDERLAAAYARRLRPEHTHLVVSQNLVPYLWSEGVLGGRSFDVLMTRLPIAELQRALDSAAGLHPDSRTCADFRAPAWLVDTETEALAAARAWITPHRAIAKLAGARAIRLEWKLPVLPPRPRGDRIVFPGSTLCRKGAYELRDAMRDVGRPLWCAGGFLEGDTFWDGVPVRRTALDWRDAAAVVVLPAFVEHRPRRLLAALAAGIPVIATPACGLEGLPGVTTVPQGDAAALAEAIRAAISQPVPAEATA